MLKLILVALLVVLASAATTVVYHKTQQADINFYRGKAYFDRGEFKQAIPYFEKSITINPFKKEAIRDLAYSYQWTNKHAKAIEYFEVAVKKYPKDFKLKVDLADTLSWQGDYKQAIALYLEVIKATGDVEVMKDLVHVYIWDKQYDRARQLLDKILSIHPDDSELDLLGAQILLYKGDYAGAQRDIEMILSRNPNNLQAKILLGDIFSYNRRFPEAIALYREIILKDNSRIAKERLADVLSWDNQYTQAYKIYDELLEEKDDPLIRRQKARALGWQRRYSESLKEYNKAFNINHDGLIYLEMCAKQAYWNGRIKRAISDYRKLIKQDVRNAEAMFDLAQIYSYQSMWKDAVTEYENILKFYPTHFRSKEGLDKIGFIRNHVLDKFGYEFLRQKSVSRDMDIRKYSLYDKISALLSDNLELDVLYKFSTRSFSDFSRLNENEGRIGFSYLNNPDWNLAAFYDYIGYSHGVSGISTFGLSAGARVWDTGNTVFSYERQRLENNSTVIRKGTYTDNYKQRIDIDINYRMKAGAEYTFMNYSDGNYNNVPGLDFLYYISLDPKRLSIKYRYFYQNYRNKTADYFAPKGFSTNLLALNWRHYLNKEDIFYGADDIYYDIGYQISVDSNYIVCNNFSAGFNWDISKRLNVNITGSLTNSSAQVYEDRSINASVKYYF